MRRCCRCAATFAQPCLVLLLKHAVLALAGCIVLASSTWPHVMCQRLPCRPPCLPCPPCSVQQQHVAHMHGTADVWAAAGPLVLRAVRPHGVRPRQGCTRWCQLAWQMFLCFGQLRGSQGRGRLASGLQHGSSSQCCDQPHRLRCPPGAPPAACLCFCTTSNPSSCTASSRPPAMVSTVQRGQQLGSIALGVAGPAPGLWRLCLQACKDVCPGHPGMAT